MAIINHINNLKDIYLINSVLFSELLNYFFDAKISKLLNLLRLSLTVLPINTTAKLKQTHVLVTCAYCLLP